MSRYYQVGKIVNTHGIRGEVRVVTISDFAEQRYRPGSTLYIFSNEHQTPAAVVVKSHRVHKSFDLLTFENHTSIADVEGYKGMLLKVAEDAREELPEGEFYYDEIIGCQVYTEEGVLLGSVSEILSTGANDVWFVKPSPQGKEILIPYIEDVVKQIDVTNRKIVILPMEGLLE
jgi:16S rRNA processing protein RimM